MHIFIHATLCVCNAACMGQVKELTCDTYKSRCMLKELPRGKAVVQSILLVCIAIHAPMLLIYFIMQLYFLDNHTHNYKTHMTQTCS